MSNPKNHALSPYILPQVSRRSWEERGMLSREDRAAVVVAWCRKEEVKELRKISRFKHRSSSLHQLRSSAKSSVGHLLHVTQCQLSGQSQYDPKLGGPNFSAHRVRNIHSAWGKFHERLLKPLLDFRDRPASAKSAQRTIRQQSITTSKTSQNGSSSLQGKGHFCLRHPLLPQPPRLAQDHPRAGR